MEKAFTIPPKLPRVSLHVSMSAETHVKLNELCAKSNRNPSDVISLLIENAEVKDA
jgi:hypothetical protein